MNVIIEKINGKDIYDATLVYISSYNDEIWKENNNFDDVYNYIKEFSKQHIGYILKENSEIIGLALCILIPCIDKPYLRIENLCIKKEKHRKGYGSIFLKLLENKAIKLNCDSILLGTQKDMPAYNFYISNKFEDIKSNLMYKEIKLNKLIKK